MIETWIMFFGGCAFGALVLLALVLWDDHRRVDRGPTVFGGREVAMNLRFEPLSERWEVCLYDLESGDALDQHGRWVPVPVGQMLPKFGVAVFDNLHIELDEVEAAADAVPVLLVGNMAKDRFSITHHFHAGPLDLVNDWEKLAERNQANCGASAKESAEGFWRAVRELNKPTRLETIVAGTYPRDCGGEVL